MFDLPVSDVVIMGVSPPLTIYADRPLFVITRGSLITFARPWSLSAAKSLKRPSRSLAIPNMGLVWLAGWLPFVSFESSIQHVANRCASARLTFATVTSNCTERGSAGLGGDVDAFSTGGLPASVFKSALGLAYLGLR